MGVVQTNLNKYERKRRRIKQFCVLVLARKLFADNALYMTMMRRALRTVVEEIKRELLPQNGGYVRPVRGCTSTSLSPFCHFFVPALTLSPPHSIVERRMALAQTPQALGFAITLDASREHSKAPHCFLFLYSVAPLVAPKTTRDHELLLVVRRVILRV